MQKLAALAITAALGIAGMGYTKPAEARVYVGVGIGLPGVAPPVVAYPPAVGVYAPYYYGYGRPYPYYYGRFGYGFRGYGYGHGVHGYGYAHGFRR
jgi:hypothetical protein